MAKYGVPNKLIQEQSPYLQQHAYNPVEWYPWCDEAFEEAKRRDVPVLLSIGYSSCHWCHVMERESFEDEETAAFLNEHFVSIKVDREERPDVDHLYMEACAALTGGGGWPLTCFLDHGRKPFYAGTYFPKGDRGGMPGFLKVLDNIHELWRGDRQTVHKAAEAVLAHLGAEGERVDTPADRACAEAHEQLRRAFDRRYGGFGGAPKFPSAHNLLFLLRYGLYAKQEDAHHMVEKTLDAMAAGGIFDHIGGGFCRYSTDGRWLVPHFEKMLYDNAMLLLAYAEAAVALGKPAYAALARRNADYVFKEMTNGEGGFLTAQDADSEGEEGRCYLWTSEEVAAVLGGEDGARFCTLMDIAPGGNFEGRSIPNTIGRTLAPEDAAFAERCFGPLLAERLKRPQPLKDDKALSSVNGLMIAALASAGRLLGEREYVDRAARAARFVLGNLLRGDRLLASWRGGTAVHPATSDDYAYLIWGLLELHQATLDPQWLQLCADWTGRMLALFGDTGKAALFLSGADVSDIPLRQKNTHDGALPSGNSIAAWNLLRLGRLIGSEEYEERANGIVAEVLSGAGGYAAGSAMLLCCTLHGLNLGTEVVLAAGKGMEEMRRACTGYHPFTVFAARGPGYETMDGLAPFATAMEPLHGAATAYLCSKGACQQPVVDAAALKAKLDGVQ